MCCDISGIGVAVFQRIRNEEDPRCGAIEIQYIGGAVVEVARTIRDE